MKRPNRPPFPDRSRKIPPLRRKGGMTHDIYDLFNVKRVRRRRTVRTVVIAFIGGVAIGGAFLFLPSVLAPDADQLLASEGPVLAMSPEQPAPSAAASQRVAMPVMRAPVEVQRSHCGRVSVHDGDTFRCDGMKVRLVAASGPVDAPEMPGSPRCEPGRDGWCDRALANQARDRLDEMLSSGPIQLDCTGADRYGRSLCRVTVSGRDAGDMLVTEGLAVVRNDWR